MARRKSFINDLSALIIASIFLAGFGYSLSHKRSTSSVVSNPDVNKASESQEASQPENPNPEKNLNKYFLYLLKTDNYSNIILENIASLEPKTIYTDKDEKQKIISVIGNNNNNAYVVESSEVNAQVGDLVSISLDGKAKKTKVQSDVSIALKPSYNPKTQELLSTSFTQVEKDFGFNLSISKLDGENRRTIQNKIPSIISPIFSNANENIYYSKSVGDERFIVSIDKNGSQLKQSKIEGIALSISSVGDKIYVAVAPFGNATANQAKTIILNSDLTKNNQELPDKNGFETDFVELDKDLIGFRRLDLASGINNENATGKVFLYDFLTKEEKEIVSANYLIGVVE